MLISGGGVGREAGGEDARLVAQTDSALDAQLPLPPRISTPPRITTLPLAPLFPARTPLACSAQARLPLACRGGWLWVRLGLGRVHLSGA